MRAYKSSEGIQPWRAYRIIGRVWGDVKWTFWERFLRVWTSWKWTFWGTILEGFDPWNRRAAATRSEPCRQNGKRSHMVQVTTKTHLGGGPFLASRFLWALAWVWRRARPPDPSWVEFFILWVPRSPAPPVSYFLGAGKSGRNFLLPWFLIQWTGCTFPGPVIGPLKGEPHAGPEPIHNLLHRSMSFFCD